MIITKNKMKEFSLFPTNFDLSEVWQFLDVTEQLFVRPMLGVDMYDEIEEQVKNNQVSPENATLLTDGGLWRYLGCAFALETLPFVYAHFSQVGVTKGKSENSDSADLKDITYLTSHLRSNLEELKRYTLLWLREHQDSFPLWNPDWNACGCEEVRDICCSDNATFVKPQPMKLVYGLPKKDLSLS